MACSLIARTGYAQVTPKWAEKAKKAVFSVVTYDKDNKIKNTGNGFYINTDGTALADYTLFEGAERAVIINADSRELPVLSIGGANSIYDVVKFTTQADKKTVALTIASRPAAVGETVYLLPYSTQKEATCQSGQITRVDTIADKAYYYTLSMTTTEKTVSCPIMNAEGEVLGLIQKSASEDAKESYAIGASYGAALSISALSANESALNNIGIKKALPDSEEQALVYLFMASSQQQPEEYLNTLNLFLNQYPNNADGYVRRAGVYMGYGDDAHNDLAEADIKKALDVTTTPGDTKYNLAKLIYNYRISLTEGQQPYAEWTGERMLSLIRQAREAEPTQMVYTQLEADILFTNGQYAEAYDTYQIVNQSDMASATSFYSAAQARLQMEGADPAEAVALMDSAIAQFTRPYISEAAPYFYERAELKAQMGKYREAVMDYDTFYEAAGGRVTALFYFQREQAEIQCKMYQQAINDINKAVEMSSEDIDLWIEKGSVHLRVGQYPEAVEALKKAISINPSAAAAYRMLGYCQVQQKQEKEACANFAKAKELGDEIVDSLIQKYCK